MGSGHGKGEQAHSLLNKATAGGHSRQTICPAQASKVHNSQLTKLAGLSPCSAGYWREYGGAGTQKVGSDLPNLSISLLPIAFACHCTYPLP